MRTRCPLCGRDGTQPSGPNVRRLLRWVVATHEDLARVICPGCKALLVERFERDHRWMALRPAEGGGWECIAGEDARLK